MGVLLLKQHYLTPCNLGTDKLVRNGRYFENSSNYREASKEAENNR
jgi:hypothetical protein